jgi:hypothetical protein
MNQEPLSNAAAASPTYPMYNPFNMQNGLIVVLILLLILSVLGINIFNLFGSILDSANGIVGPFISQFFGLVGNVAGSTINTSADLVAGVTKTGINVADGAAHSIGNILKNKSNPGVYGPAEIDVTINDNRVPNSFRTPDADSSESPIQNSISSGKAGWCLVGEYENRRGCIQVSDADKCMSGQVFPSQQLCLNPTMTP